MTSQAHKCLRLLNLLKTSYKNYSEAVTELKITWWVTKSSRVSFPNLEVHFSREGFFFHIAVSRLMSNIFPALALVRASLTSTSSTSLLTSFIVSLA